MTPSPSQSPSAAECVPIAVLALEVLADLRRWAGEHPVVASVPLEAMAISAAMISPWRNMSELRLAARMCVWTYALDDETEQRVTDLDDLDDLLDRCNAVVRGGEPDDGRPLLSALSRWQAEAAQQPGYGPLATLWAEKFAMGLAGMRYDWVVGPSQTSRRRALGCPGVPAPCRQRPIGHHPHSPLVHR